MATDGEKQSRWQGREYSPHAGHHRSHDDWFLAAHPPRPVDVVVDTGCGTGEFTVALADLVPEGRAIGVEPDASMLEQAQRHVAPNLEFRTGSVQHLDEICDLASVDLVVSRAMFHWLRLQDYTRAYGAIRRVLTPGGWFHAESGGTGNLGRVVALMNEIAADHGLPPARVTFPDAGTVLELLEDAGFELDAGAVTTIAQRRHFDRDQLTGFVRTQAALAYVAGVAPESREAYLRAAVARIDDLRRNDGTYDQTFVRLHVLCRRPI